MTSLTEYTQYRVKARNYYDYQLCARKDVFDRALSACIYVPWAERKAIPVWWHRLKVLTDSARNRREQPLLQAVSAELAVRHQGIIPAHGALSLVSPRIKR